MAAPRRAGAGGLPPISARSASTFKPPSRTGTMNSSVSASSSRFAASVSSSEGEGGATPVPSAGPSSPSKRATRGVFGAQPPTKKVDDGSNIKVFVRVRGQAPGEAPVPNPVLSTEGPKCASIHVQLEPPPVSSLSGVPSSSLVTSSETSSREKTYNFDNVFGPEADQGMVYQTVVTPALGEVLAGYNCTVFAYGQTGTGKTHTMEGDLTSQLGTYSAEAGIIPRTLYRLFHQLELSEKEYSVHASFVELYNEELRDLLSAEQPKSLASGGLRMYDDKNKGVVLQGLEDIPMSDASHGLELLRRGSHKRQIASTNCNEASSRSHSVFTLTVHTKETTSKGEDVVRVGKLNLVDLAGSENIGRSGAENKRAREAGMINQSLLTLGRVINALVEKSPHVPYRESKLTRLLQESLGGRTKTCIIATVSADKSNQEETLSTLDYALRAKSIKNRPEMNSRMTRAGLINEYVKEIEKLKRDVLAARLQEGVYISDESYKEMQEEADARKNTADELRRVVEVAESKRASLQEQFEQNMQLLLKRDGEIKTVKTECADKKRELDQAIDQARELQAAVAEEKELREAYRNSEKKLDKIASGLRAQAKESQSDLGGLFAKLDRKTKVEQSNQRLVKEYRDAVSLQTSALHEYTADFQASQEEFANTLSSKLQAYHRDEESALATSTQNITTELKALRTLTDDLGSNLDIDHDRIQVVSAGIDAVKQQVSNVMQQRTVALRTEWDELQKFLMDSHSSSLDETKTALQSLQGVVASIVQHSRKHMLLEYDRIAQVKALAEKASQREVASLRQQNELLTALLQEERAKSSQMRERLAKSISDLVLGYTAERDESLTKAIGSVQTQMTASEANASAFAQDHSDQMGKLEKASQEYSAWVTERGKEAKRHLKGGETSLQTTQEQLGEAVQILSENMSKSLAGTDEEVNGAVSDLYADVQEKHLLAKESHQAQRRRLQQVVDGVESTTGAARKQLSSTLHNVGHVSSTCSDLTSDHIAHSEGFFSHVGESLNRMQTSTRRHLSEGFARDVPTGKTPMKKDGLVGGDVTWKLVPATRQRALEQYRHMVAKKQASLNRKGQRGLSLAPSEVDGTLGSLPDDTRETIDLGQRSDDGSERESEYGGTDAGSERGDDFLHVGAHSDAEGDGRGVNDEDDSSSFDDSLGGTLTENDETVRIGGDIRTARPSTLAPQPKHLLKRRAPTTLLAPPGSRKVPANRSVSAASLGRNVLSEKTHDPNVVVVEERTTTAGKKTIPALRKGGPQNGAGGRRLTRA